MSAYADTSFLFSLYVADSNSSKALSLVKSAPLPWLATPFCEFELENAICLLQFRRGLNQSDVKTSLAAFRNDIANSVFTVKSFSAEILHRASLISTRRTASLGCRALDVLHVASAVMLGAEEFYTFDERQAKLARAEGLNVRGIS